MKISTVVALMAALTVQAAPIIEPVQNLKRDVEVGTPEVAANIGFARKYYKRKPEEAENFGFDSKYYKREPEEAENFGFDSKYYKREPEPTPEEAGLWDSQYKR